MDKSSHVSSINRSLFFTTSLQSTDSVGNLVHHYFLLSENFEVAHSLPSSCYCISVDGDHGVCVGNGELTTLEFLDSKWAPTASYPIPWTLSPGDFCPFSGGTVMYSGARPLTPDRTVDIWDDFSGEFELRMAIPPTSSSSSVQWPYQLNLASSFAVLLSCNGQDNDCDGLSDEWTVWSREKGMWGGDDLVLRKRPGRVRTAMSSSYFVVADSDGLFFHYLSRGPPRTNSLLNTCDLTYSSNTPTGEEFSVSVHLTAEMCNQFLF